MKRTLLIVVSFFTLFTLANKVEADSYFTSQSTAINISSYTGFVVEKIILSTGATTRWILLVDSAAASVGTEETNLVGAGVCEAGYWPVAQWLYPKILYTDTDTVNTSGLQVIPIGLQVENGLVVCQNTVGGTWTLVTSRRTTGGSPERGEVPIKPGEKITIGKLNKEFTKIE